MSKPNRDDALPVPILTGDLVGNYRIEGVIADGGMGVVYRAKHTILPRRAAVKVLHPSLVGQWSSSERMLQEARVLESIAAPSVVDVYDAGVLEDGRPWVAMELVEGETLADLLLRRGALAPVEVVELLIGIVDALAVAHQHGVIHRDVKPDNVMLTGQPRAVKLIDWGIARVSSRSSDRITQVDTVPGTPSYMAPEQIRGHALDARADIYSLGVVAYELLTGKTPYRGASVLEIVLQHLTADAPPLSAGCPGIAPGLEALVGAMLRKASRERPALDEVRARLVALRAVVVDPRRSELEVEMEILMEVDDEADTTAIPEPIESEAARDTVPDHPQRRAGLRWTPRATSAPGEPPRGEIRRRGAPSTAAVDVSAAGELDAS
jgi:serine/threonine-protein kinase